MDTTTAKVQKEWSEIAEREPRLLAIYERAKAKATRTTNLGPVHRIWYGQFKPVLIKLVGFAREDDATLGTH